MSTTSTITKTTTSRKKMRLINVDNDNYNKLRMLGHVPDSFNTVISRLLHEHYQHVAVAAGGSSSKK